MSDSSSSSLFQKYQFFNPSTLSSSTPNRRRSTSPVNPLGHLTTIVHDIGENMTNFSTNMATLHSEVDSLKNQLSVVVNLLQAQAEARIPQAIPISIPPVSAPPPMTTAAPPLPNLNAPPPSSYQASPSVPPPSLPRPQPNPNMQQPFFLNNKPRHAPYQPTPIHYTQTTTHQPTYMNQNQQQNHTYVAPNPPQRRPNTHPYHAPNPQPNHTPYFLPNLNPLDDDLVSYAGSGDDAELTDRNRYKNEDDRGLRIDLPEFNGALTLMIS